MAATAVKQMVVHTKASGFSAKHTSAWFVISTFHLQAAKVVACTNCSKATVRPSVH